MRIPVAVLVVGDVLLFVGGAVLGASVFYLIYRKRVSTNDR